MARPAAASTFAAWKSPTSGSGTSYGRPKTESVSRCPSTVGDRGTDTKVVAADAVGNYPQAVAAWRRGAPASAAGSSAQITAAPAGIDQLGEQPQLRREVGLHGAVIVQVIAGQVGERGGRDAHPIEAVLVAGRGSTPRWPGAATPCPARSASVRCRLTGSGVVRLPALPQRRRGNAERAERRGGHGRALSRSGARNQTTEVLPLVPVTAATVFG